MSYLAARTQSSLVLDQVPDGHERQSLSREVAVMGTQHLHAGDGDGVPVAMDALSYGLGLCSLLTKHIDTDHPERRDLITIRE